MIFVPHSQGSTLRNRKIMSPRHRIKQKVAQNFKRRINADQITTCASVWPASQPEIFKAFRGFPPWYTWWDTMYSPQPMSLLGCQVLYHKYTVAFRRAKVSIQWRDGPIEHLHLISESLFPISHISPLSDFKSHGASVRTPINIRSFLTGRSFTVKAGP